MEVEMEQEINTRDPIETLITYLQESYEENDEDVIEAMEDENDENDDDEWEDEEEEEEYDYEEYEVDEDGYRIESGIADLDEDIEEESTGVDILDLLEQEEQNRLKDQLSVVEAIKVVEAEDESPKIYYLSKPLELSHNCTINVSIKSQFSSDDKNYFQIYINDNFKRPLTRWFDASFRKFNGYMSSKDALISSKLLETILDKYIESTFGKLFDVINMMGFTDDEYSFEVPSVKQCWVINGNNSNTDPIFTPPSLNALVPVFIFQLRFKDITCVNDDKQKHYIHDIIYQLVFSSNGNVRLRATAPQLTNIEINCDFPGQPHVHDNKGFAHVCLGNGVIGGHLMSLQNCLNLESNSGIEKVFNNLIASIISASQYEDLVGRPYHAISNIKYVSGASTDVSNIISRMNDNIAYIYNELTTIPVKPIQSVNKTFKYTIDKKLLFVELDKLVKTSANESITKLGFVLDSFGNISKSSSSSKPSTLENEFKYNVPYYWNGELFEKVINVDKYKTTETEAIYENKQFPLFIKEAVYNRLISDLNDNNFNNYLNNKYKI